MCRRTNLGAAGLLFLWSLAPAGCQKVFRSETIWRADGSVDRAIYQEWDATPVEIRRPEVWLQTTTADRGWSAPIRMVPIRKRGAGGPYFAAWGRFNSPQDLPAHFLQRAELGPEVAESKLIRDCRWTDYVFVREYRWRETLTDVVKFEEMCKARGQLADLLIDLFQAGFNENFGREYDVSDLVKWLREDGKAWLDEITDYAYVHAAIQKGPSSFHALADGLAEICARHGLPLKARGKLLESQELDNVLRDFAREKIAQHVRRRKDGKLVDRKMAGKFLVELDQAIEGVIDRRYGRKKFEKILVGLIMPIVGLHCIQWFQQNDFDYALTVPGEVIKTNGRILSSNKVSWQFDEREAYPLGYVMECRSLLPDRDIQKSLLHKQPLTTRDKMLEFVALVSDHAQLRETLQQCRKRKNIGPLYEYQQKTAPANDEVRNMSRLLKLLGLPQQPE